MPDIDLSTIGEASGSLTFTRQGVAVEYIALGDVIEFETTIMTLPTGTRLGLKEMWTGTATRDQKKTDGSKSDVYSRYALDPEDLYIDNYDVTISSMCPKAYREIMGKVFQVSGGDEKASLTAFGFIESGSSWVRIGEKKLTFNVDDIYLRFIAGDRGIEFDEKDNEKAVTVTVKGVCRQLKSSNNFANLVSDEFRPFKVKVVDRFKNRKAINSYRTAPDGSSTTETIVDDSLKLEEYAIKLKLNNDVQTISGAIELIGVQSYGVGDKIDSIILPSGLGIPIGLAIKDVQVMYEPVRESGQGITGDRTLVSFGRD